MGGQYEKVKQKPSDVQPVPPYIVHVPSGPILPAEVDEGVVRLLDVDLTFALIGGHRAALHGHLTCPELHQVLAGGATGPRHQAGEQSSRGHDEKGRVLQGRTGGRSQTHKLSMFETQEQLKVRGHLVVQQNVIRHTF